MKFLVVSERPCIMLISSSPPLELKLQAPWNSLLSGDVMNAHTEKKSFVFIEPDENH